MAHYIEKTVVITIFVGIGLVFWFAYDRRLNALQLREDIDILVRRIERLEAKQ